MNPDAAGLPGVFGRYREILDRERLVDFDEQVYRAIQVLLTDPEARHGAQARARHLLVDEVQDLAPAHLLLLRLVSAPVLDCFGVGDDDQVIYGYAGADPGYLIDFDRYFPGATPYALEVDYRCPPGVVQATTHYLSHTRRRIGKVIRPAPGRPAAAPDLVVRPVAAEAVGPAVVDQVTTWREGEVSWSDMAVLARVNSALLGPQVALTVAGVPATTPLDAKVLDRTGTRAALAYLRIAADPGHVSRADLAETIRRPSRRIARNVVEMLARRPFTSVDDVRRLAGRLSGGDVAKLPSYADELDSLSRAAPAGTAAVLAAVRTTIGLGEAMDTLDGSRGSVDRSSHGDDLAALEQVAALHPEVATFEPWLRGLLGRRPPPGGDGGDGAAGLDGATTGGRVELSTVHRVKGREWGHVAVIGAQSDLFPHRLAGDPEEERRV
ncbi:MAG: UvrD-helicase domain-containing protein, partial [Acidimicrobiales bacterium]